MKYKLWEKVKVDGAVYTVVGIVDGGLYNLRLTPNKYSLTLKEEDIKSAKKIRYQKPIYNLYDKVVYSGEPCYISEVKGVPDGSVMYILRNKRSNGTFCVKDVKNIIPMKKYIDDLEDAFKHAQANKLPLREVKRLQKRIVYFYGKV